MGELPRSPQHLKYCSTGSASKSDSLEEATSDPPQSPREQSQSSKPACLEVLTAGKHKLRLLFQEIDKKGTGFVTHRSVMFTLHQRLYEQFGDSDGVREATSWLREAAKELDGQNTGVMDWKAFLDFTRRSGIFLEYQSQKEANSELDVVKEALKDQQEELKNQTFACVKDHDLEIRSEIRISVGRDNAARFNSNRRAGSPEEKEELS